MKYISKCGKFSFEDNEDCICFYKNGLLHRDIKPAIIYENGIKKWYQNGILHRDLDFPAIENPLQSLKTQILQRKF